MTFFLLECICMILYLSYCLLQSTYRDNNCTIMSVFYQEKEARMACALEAAAAEERPNIAQLAKEHQVDRKTLTRRLGGGSSKTTQPAANRRLTAVQESALKSYVRDLEWIGGACSVHQLESAANYFLNKGRNLGGLDESEVEPLTVGSTWTTRFLQRNPDCHLIKQYPMEPGRMVAEDRGNIEFFYNQLEKVIEDVPDSDLWNMDESGFQIGMGGDRNVVSIEYSKRKHYLASQGDKELVTITECINAAGDVIPPMLTISGKLFNASLVRNDLHPDTLLTLSDAAFINDILVLQWFEHFVRLTRKMTKGTKRVLIMDGQSCHATAEVIDLCNDSNITLLSLPLHTTHLLQPLDLGVFGPYKHFHKKAVNDAAAMGVTFRKAHFFGGLEDVRKQTFKRNTVKGGWRMSGIRPFKPSLVLDEIDRRAGLEVTRAPSPPLSIPSSPIIQPTPIRQPPKTPSTLKELQDLADYLQGPAYEQRDVSPSPGKMMKGALALAFEKEQLLEDLRKVRAFQSTAQKRFDDGGRRHLSKDSITVREGRHIDAEKLAEEKVKADKRKAHAEKGAKKRDWDAMREEIRVSKEAIGQGFFAELDVTAEQARKKIAIVARAQDDSEKTPYVISFMFKCFRLY